MTDYAAEKEIIIFFQRLVEEKILCRSDNEAGMEGRVSVGVTIDLRHSDNRCSHDRTLYPVRREAAGGALFASAVIRGLWVQGQSAFILRSV